MGMSLPIRVFEVQDVVLKEKTAETGAKNHRRIGALIYNRSPNFEEILGLLRYIMVLLEVPLDRAKGAEGNKGYYLVRSAGMCHFLVFWARRVSYALLFPHCVSIDPAFFGELGAIDVIYNGMRVGVAGVVHPEVLLKYNLKNPCGALEMDLEPFL